MPGCRRRSFLRGASRRRSRRVLRAHHRADVVADPHLPPCVRARRLTAREAPTNDVPRVLGAGITLAHGRSFAICDETGDVDGGVQGIYVGDTRISARLEITFDGER